VMASSGNIAETVSADHASARAPEAVPARVETSTPRAGSGAILGWLAVLTLALIYLLVRSFT